MYATVRPQPPPTGPRGWSSVGLVGSVRSRYKPLAGVFPPPSRCAADPVRNGRVPVVASRRMISCGETLPHCAAAGRGLRSTGRWMDGRRASTLTHVHAGGQNQTKKEDGGRGRVISFMKPTVCVCRKGNAAVLRSELRLAGDH